MLDAMLPGRARSNWLSRRSAAAAVAVLLAAIFAILAYEATERELLPGDQTMRESLRAWQQPELHHAMDGLSMLGAGKVLIPLNVLVVWVLWRLRHRNVLLISTLTLGAVAAETLLKWLVHRPRPKDVGYGFPSGHVMVSIVFFGLVLYLLWQARGGDAVAWLATMVGVLAVVAIGVSRVYLNAHWLSDVLGAAAGGLAFLIFAVLRLGPHLCAREVSGELPVAARARPTRVRWMVWASVVVLAVILVGASLQTSAGVTHMAFELLCVIIALGAVVGRTYALRHATSPAAVYAAEAIIILALASFPAHVWVFVAGLVVAVSYAYLRWRRPALPDRPHVWAAALLMLALPLDILEDVLQGEPVTADPIWLISALLGVVLLTWRHLRPVTA